jgi:amino acid permease
MPKDNLFRNYIYPITVFSSGMIGVGFLSLPYIASKVGIWPMLFYFLVITALIVFINLIFCDLSLKTPDFKRFPGFVGYYLGKWPEVFTMISTIVGTLGVLLAYLIVAGQFLTAVLQPMFGGSELLYIFIYFIAVSLIIYFDIKIVARIEFVVLVLLFFSILFIFIDGFSQIKLSNIFTTGQISHFFLPYGPLLFALWGVSLIPEVEEMLRGRKGNLKKNIVFSTILVSIFYLLFTILILGITGVNTGSVALTSLKNFISDQLVSLALLVGTMATFTAFIAQGIIFKKTLVFDLGIKHWQAFVMTCFTPMILFLLGLKSFIPILSLVGGVLLGINGILILLMYKKIPAYQQSGQIKKAIVNLLALVFVIGVAYEIIYFVK